MFAVMELCAQIRMTTLFLKTLLVYDWKGERQKPECGGLGPEEGLFLLLSHSVPKSTSLGSSMEVTANQGSKFYSQKTYWSLLVNRAMTGVSLNLLDRCLAYGFIETFVKLRRCGFIGRTEISALWCCSLPYISRECTVNTLVLHSQLSGNANSFKYYICRALKKIFISTR